jgi:GTPase SAR1 family protein
VFDLSKNQSFENVRKWLAELRDNSEPIITIMLIGNKSDLNARDVKRDAIYDFVTINKLLYQEASALSGDNVEKCFGLLIEGRLFVTQRYTGKPRRPMIGKNK